MHKATTKPADPSLLSLDLLARSLNLFFFNVWSVQIMTALVSIECIG